MNEFNALFIFLGIIILIIGMIVDMPLAIGLALDGIGIFLLLFGIVKKFERKDK